MFQMQMYKSILLATSVALSACGILPTGDGAMGITGNLAKFTGEDCLARIQLPSGREVWLIDLLPDEKGNFSHIFSVAPRSEEYTIKIECGGVVVASKTALYPEGLENEFYLRFGELGSDKT